MWPVFEGEVPLTASETDGAGATAENPGKLARGMVDIAGNAVDMLALSLLTVLCL